MKTIIGTLLLIFLISISIGSANSPPANPATLAGPTTGTSGTPYSYSTSAIDLDGGQINITIEWGDGSKNTTQAASGTTVTASHAWIVPAGSSKTFNLRAKATDPEGSEANCWSSPLSVSITGPELPPPDPTNHPPRTAYIPDGPMSGKPMILYTYKSLASDQDGDKVKISFDWGDGTSNTTGLVASTTYISASHRWPAMTPGTSKSYSVRAKATDEHGLESTWSSPLKVLILAPTVYYPPSNPIMAGPTTGRAGVIYPFTVVSTDRNNDTIRYQVSWGDGFDNNTALFPSGQIVTVNHAWVVPTGKTWTYEVSAWAVDRYQKSSLGSSVPLRVAITG